MKTIRKISLFVLVAILALSICQPLFADSQKININSASKEELMTLKYVGDKIADRIIEYRKAHPFEQPEDFMLVKGIGEKVFDANKDIIVVKDT
jgi:competence protein ComEA